MKLVKDAQLFGIYKAIGYTTPQLILQNVYAYVPVVTIGTLLGGLLGYFGKDVTLRATIGLFTGIEKNVMVFTPYSVIITLLLVMATAIISSILGSLKVRYIKPVKMIKEL
jgi:putative ABC transport system permease protein